MSKLREDNARLGAECNLLKNDNTELLHSCSQLRIKVGDFSEDNKKLENEIDSVKNLINRII